MKTLRINDWYIDLVTRLGSFWVGVHYSSNYQAYCISPLPCITLRIGKTKYKKEK